MQKKFYFIFFLVPFLSYSQETPNFSAIDSLYREDQLYFNILYNILKSKPVGVSQNSFSTGLNLGFLRDFPINKKRTIAIAPGLGLSYNNYKENLLVGLSNSNLNYSTIPSGINYDKNKLALYFIDLPVEFRWRSSTPDSHKFWRVYVGFKLSYLFLSQSRYSDANQLFKINNNPDLNKFQYGTYIATGYNSWNLYAYYGLNNMFKKGTINNEKLELSSFNLGLMFYIL